MPMVYSSSLSTSAETHHGTLITGHDFNNPAFSWTYETSFGGPPTITCSHPGHQDVPDDWITEPCEHCGADIIGVDWYAPDVVELDVGGFLSLQVVPSSGYYIVHPCGHVIQTFDMRQLTPEEIVLRQSRGE